MTATTHLPEDSRHPRVDVLRRAMAALTALDPDALSPLLHDDLLFQLPYERQVPDLDKAGFLELLRSSSFTLYRQFTITLSPAPPFMVIASGMCFGFCRSP